MTELPVFLRRLLRPFIIGILLFMMLLPLTLLGCVRPTPAADNSASSANPPDTEPDSTAATDQTADNQPGELADTTASAATEDPPLEQEDSDFFILHSVEEGDTLGTIAKQYETSTAELLALNQIANSDIIFTGQILRVPGPEFESLISPSFEIIPDSELVYGPAAKTFDLNTYAAPLGGYLLAYEEEVEEKLLSGPDVVQLVADRHSVNPKLLLAALEYQSGWLTESQPTETTFPMGYLDEDSSGLYKQLSWAANLFNWGFYGRADGGMTSFLINDEIPISFSADISFGTSGVQNYLAARDDINYETWFTDVGPEGFFNTYDQLFGDPFEQEIQPLVPTDLSQPPFKLPWASGETWFFTGGPHGGWNSGSAWAALDFVPPKTLAGCSPSDSWATAVADGVVSRSGFGAVVLDLDGDGYSGTGWAVTYMHLEDRDRAPAGARVAAGDQLGHPGCEGGFTNGTHIHLARTYNGRWISADTSLPFDFDGWVSQGAGSEYNGSLVRDGEIKTADIYQTEDNAITAD